MIFIRRFGWHFWSKAWSSRLLWRPSAPREWDPKCEHRGFGGATGAEGKSMVKQADEKTWYEKVTFKNGKLHVFRGCYLFGMTNSSTCLLLRCDFVWSTCSFAVNWDHQVLTGASCEIPLSPFKTCRTRSCGRWERRRSKRWCWDSWNSTEIRCITIIGVENVAVWCEDLTKGNVFIGRMERKM